MIDCLKYAVKKENEIPQIIDIIFTKLLSEKNFNIPSFTKKMRSAEEILKDYGIKRR